MTPLGGICYTRSSTTDIKPSGSGKLSKRDALKNNYSIFPIKWEDLMVLRKGYCQMFNAHISQLGSSFNDDIELDVNKMSKKFSLSSLQKEGQDLILIAKSINQKSLEINF